MKHLLCKNSQSQEISDLTISFSARLSCDVELESEIQTCHRSPQGKEGQLYHFHEEEEKDGNRYRISLFTWHALCVLNPLEPPV